MLRLIRHPATWFGALAAWFGLLWYLSSLPGSNVPAPIPHFDKFLHFSYFLVGGVLCAGGHARLMEGRPDWKRILITAVVAMAAIGFLDEWHQCYTPLRSGADPFDWLADVIGATAGAFFLKLAHPRLH